MKQWGCHAVPIGWGSSTSRVIAFVPCRTNCIRWRFLALMHRTNVSSEKSRVYLLLYHFEGGGRGQRLGLVVKLAIDLSRGLGTITRGSRVRNLLDECWSASFIDFLRDLLAELRSLSFVLSLINF